MFGLFSKKNSQKTDSNVDRKNYLFERLDEDLGQIERTDDPDSFFLRYKDAVDACAELLSLKLGDEIDSKMLETLHYLFGSKTELINKFIDRSSSSGRLSYDTDKIIQHKDDMTAESYDYFLSLTGLGELSYTYCTVTFGGNHTYDYICEISDISVGDDVIVPVGEEEIEKLAKVTAIKKYRYDEVPYPVSKTKKIIAKYGCGL